MHGLVLLASLAVSEAFPPLADACRFPSADYARQLCSFNEAYRDRLCTLATIYPHRADDIQDQVERCHRLYWVWRQVWIAGDEGRDGLERREALFELRQAIGEEAYYSGRLPPHAPFGW